MFELFDVRPVSYLLKQARKYLDLAKEDLIFEQREEYTEIVETLLNQTDAYMNAFKEIGIFTKSQSNQFKSLRWRVYKWLFGEPHIEITTTFLRRNGTRYYQKPFWLYLGKDTLVYKINATDEEQAKGYDTEL